MTFGIGSIGSSSAVLTLDVGAFKRAADKAIWDEAASQMWETFEKHQDGAPLRQIAKDRGMSLEAIRQEYNRVDQIIRHMKVRANQANK